MTAILKQNVELGKVIAVVAFAITSTITICNWKNAQDEANKQLNSKMDVILSNQEDEKAFRDSVNVWHISSVTDRAQIKKDVSYLYGRMRISRNEGGYFTERRVNGRLEVIPHRYLSQ